MLELGKSFKGSLPQGSIVEHLCIYGLPEGTQRVSSPLQREISAQTLSSPEWQKLSQSQHLCKEG